MTVAEPSPSEPVALRAVDGEAGDGPPSSLVSREVFLTRLATALERPGASVAVVYVTLDRFRSVNAALGHEVGDFVLAQVGGRLGGIGEGRFATASFGTDEFAMCVDSIGDLAEVFAVAERVRWELTKPFLAGEDEIALGASIGVAFGRGGEISAGQLVQNADGAALRAREGGGNRVGTFEPRIGLRALTRVRGDAPLRRALERSEFHLHYQPIVSTTRGEGVGVEALIRWGTPETRLIMPANFIPLSEETGFIVPLGEWAFREACEQFVNFAAARPELAPAWISVNLSARQLYVRESIESFEETVRSTGIPPEKVVLEITESALMDETPLLWQALHRLSEVGLKFSLDDFGTRYSSLAYLRRFDFDTVKIDRSFVQELETSERDATIVESVVNLAHGLGLDVVVEGVETEAQLEIVRRLGADWAQGYHLSRPVTGTALVEVLENLVPFHSTPHHGRPE